MNIYIFDIVRIRSGIGSRQISRMRCENILIFCLYSWLRFSNITDKNYPSGTRWVTGLGHVHRVFATTQGMLVLWLGQWSVQPSTLSKASFIIMNSFLLWLCCYWLIHWQSIKIVVVVHFLRCSLSSIFRLLWVVSPVRLVCCLFASYHECFPVNCNRLWAFSQ